MTSAMKFNTILFASVLLLVTGCSTVKKNGYYQTRKYKPKSGRTQLANRFDRKGKAETQSDINAYKLVSKPLDLSAYQKNNGKEFLPQASIINQKKLYNNTAQIAEDSEFKAVHMAERVKNSPDSCDNIILRDGSEIRGYVVELGVSEIRYKKCEYKDGPTVVIEKSKVFMIQYVNGSKDVFSAEVEPRIDNRERNNVETRTNTVDNSGKKAVLLAFGIIFILLGLVTFLFLSMIVGGLFNLIGVIFIMLSI